ncbi:hypothetical protein Trydic_g4380 [Trypoxylus dichotomus]
MPGGRKRDSDAPNRERTRALRRQNSGNKPRSGRKQTESTKPEEYSAMLVKPRKNESVCLSQYFREHSGTICRRITSNYIETNMPLCLGLITTLSIGPIQKPDLNPIENLWTDDETAIKSNSPASLGGFMDYCRRSTVFQYREWKVCQADMLQY